MMLTRRQIARFAAALPLLRPASAAIALDPDVVIVGAGAAGIAAAQVLTAGGRRVQVIEAAARIGGRCFTDSATFGVPFDRGAAWLKGGDRNPLAGFARLYRFHLTGRDAPEHIFARGTHVPLRTNSAFERALIAVSNAIAEAAEHEDDIAASEAPPALPDDEARGWAATASNAVGPLDMGVDLNALSVKDWFQREEDDERVSVREGLGTLVARIATNLPIAVNTTARRITVADRGALVETDRGTILTRAVIVTASVGVLADQLIKFEPAPPSDLLDAFNGLRMGLVTRIAMHFAQGSRALAFAPESLLIPQLSDERGHVFRVRPLGGPLVECHVGGSLAWALSKQPDHASIDFARDRLRALLGTNADSGLRNAAVTDWGRNPLSRGAFAAALPGQWKARRALDVPINERVFLAGEAQGGRAVQTVHGAFQSGQRAGRRVLQLLKA